MTRNQANPPTPVSQRTAVGRAAQENLWVQVCKRNVAQPNPRTLMVPRAAGETESGGPSGVLPRHAHRLGEDAWAHSEAGARAYLSEKRRRCGTSGCKSTAGYMVQRSGSRMSLLVNGNGQGKEKTGWPEMWRGGNHRRWEKTVPCDSWRVHEGKSCGRSQELLQGRDQITKGHR